MRIFQNLTILLFVATLLRTSITSFVVQVTCKPCSISCHQSNCYRISTDGYDEEVCQTKSCSLSYHVNMTISQCQASSNGVSCSSELCVTSSTMSMCMANGYCPSSYWVYSTCGTCTTIACSGKCMMTQTSLIHGTQESCYGQSCSGIQTINMTISPCSSGTDFFGNACNCCMSGSVAGDMFFTCSQSSGLFSSHKFKTYSANKLNGQKQKNNQSYTIYFISLMLLLLGVLAL